MRKYLGMAAALLTALSFAAGPALAENVVRLICKCQSVTGDPEHQACTANDDMVLKVDLDHGKAELPWPIKDDGEAMITPDTIIIFFDRHPLSVMAVQRTSGNFIGMRDGPAEQQPELGRVTMTGICQITKAAPEPAVQP